MKSRVKGRDYLILKDGDRFYTKVNKNRLDRALRRVISALEIIEKELDEPYDIRDLMMEEVFYYVGSSTYCDEKFRVDWALGKARELQEFLETHNDDIPEPEDVERVEDIGFRRQIYSDNRHWEKMIQDTGEQEIVEEILLLDKPVRRKRTIDFEITDYGKSSTNIVYKTLPIGKRLMKIIQNTIRDYEQD